MAWSTRACASSEGPAMSTALDLARPDIRLTRVAAPHPMGRLGGFIARKPLGAVGRAIVLVLLVLAAGAPLLSPYSFDVGIANERLQAPSLAHPFGTDANGRDMLSRIIWGARVSVTVGFGAVLLSTFLAVSIGLL